MADELSLAFLLLSTCVVGVSALAGVYLILDLVTFLRVLIGLEFGLLVVFTCTSLFVFLVAFECITVPIFLMILCFGSSRYERVKAIFIFLSFTIYGSLVLVYLILCISDG